MGYKIVYGPELIQNINGRSRTGRIQIFTAVFLLLFALTARQCWPEGAERLRDFFVPGEMSATEEIFTQMIADLQQGEPIGDALTAFCVELIAEGQNCESQN